MPAEPSRDQPSPAPLAVVTGSTGFIGRHLVAALAHAGWRVRLLVRREPRFAEWRGLQPELVPGSLEDIAALERLLPGADAVLHAGGLIKAARRQRFFQVNSRASEMLARLTRLHAPQAHFVYVSSLAAREPELSDYAASKRAGEDAVRAVLERRVTILRPPAVYGPGDLETLRFFRIAQGRLVPLPGPPQARAALIHVQDLARLLAVLAASQPRGEIWAAADAQPQGYGWAEILAAAAHAVGNAQPRFVRAPHALLRTVAWTGDVARLLGAASMFNSQKLREISHIDWTVAPTEQAKPPGWSPRFALAPGFADTVAWYRAAGWL